MARVNYPWVSVLHKAKSFALVVLAVSTILAVFDRRAWSDTHQEADQDHLWTLSPRVWPRNESAVFKLSETLVLAIPAEFDRFWFERSKAEKLPTTIASLPISHKIAFTFFLPDFTGLDENRYAADFSLAKVEVIYLTLSDPTEFEKDGPGFYPPNVRARAEDFAKLIKREPTQMFGLTCYAGPGSMKDSDRLVCFNSTDVNDQSQVVINVASGTGPSPFPLMEARYATKRYGGLRIAWRTHASHLQEWEKIDSHIWRWIENWNLTPTNQMKHAKGKFDATG